MKNKLACEHGHQRGKCVYCDNEELRRENAELRKLLKKLEWRGATFVDTKTSGDWPCCPGCPDCGKLKPGFCGNGQDASHFDRCELAQMLKGGGE